MLRGGGRRPYRFDPGALCLELLATGGPGDFARFEVLTEPAAVIHWAAESRLAPGLELAVDEGSPEAVRYVRDALWRAAAARAHERAPDPADLVVINAAAAEAPLVPRIAPDGGRGWAPGPASVTALLSTVARDAVDLFTGPFAHRVRECATHNCFLLFVDTSRPGRRRWCAMGHCGNRSKVRAHRARRAEGDGPMTDRTDNPTASVDTPAEAADTPTGLTKDAGWEIGVSRTLLLPPAAVWDFMASPEGVRLWLGELDEGADLPTAKGGTYETADGVRGEVRGYRPGERIRVTYGPSTVQIAVSPARSGQGTRLTFHQEHLADAAERESRRAHWQAVAERVKEALGVS